MLVTPGEIIKTSWQTYTKNWRTLSVYMVSMFLPTLILSLLSAGFLYIASLLGSFVPGNVVIIALVFAASFVFTIWVSIALARTLKNLLTNQPILPWKEEMNNSSHLIWPMTIASLLVAVIVLGGTLLFIIPGIIFSIWYSFTFYCVVFEGKKTTDALRLSKSLVVGRWWAILWRIVGPSLAFGISASIIIGIINRIIMLAVSDSFMFSIIAGLTSSIINTIVAPLTAMATVILFLSAKANPVTTQTPVLPPR